MNFSVFSVIDAIFLVSKEFNEQNTRKKMPFWIFMSFHSMAELALFFSRRIYLMKKSGRIWHKYMNALEKKRHLLYAEESVSVSHNAQLLFGLTRISAKTKGIIGACSSEFHFFSLLCQEQCHCAQNRFLFFYCSIYFIMKSNE